MAEFSLSQFKINNTFEEWETTFYNALNPVRKMGINSIRHGHQTDDTEEGFVMMMEESDTWSKFYDENQRLIENSGDILGSIKVTYYEN